MRYPIMNERDLATRWNLSLKTLRRWRQAKLGPVYHKLFWLVRYAESDVVAFERRCSRHWAALADREKIDPRLLEAMAADPSSMDEAASGDPAESKPEPLYVGAKEAASITRLPSHYFIDRWQRDRLRIPYLELVGAVRFSIDEIYRWEISNSTHGFDCTMAQKTALTDSSLHGVPNGLNTATLIHCGE